VFDSRRRRGDDDCQQGDDREKSDEELLHIEMDFFCEWCLDKKGQWAFIFIVGERKERRDKSRYKVEEVTGGGGKEGLIVPSHRPIEGLFSDSRCVGTVTFRSFDGYVDMSDPA